MGQDLRTPPSNKPAQAFAGRGRALLALCLAALGCETLSSAQGTCRPGAPAGPQAALEAYARALESGRLGDAYALTTSKGEGISQGAFEARYANPAARARRASEVRAASGALRASGPGAALSFNRGWRVLEPDASRALARFVAAAEAGDFATAYGLLAGQWRARYTPERLASDFRAEPLSRERLERAKWAAEQSPPQVSGGEVRFPLGGDKAVRMVREGGDFKVAALE